MQVKNVSFLPRFHYFVHPYYYVVDWKTKSYRIKEKNNFVIFLTENWISDLHQKNSSFSKRTTSC